MERARHVGRDLHIESCKLSHEAALDGGKRHAIAVDDPAAPGGTDPFARSDDADEVQRIGGADRDELAVGRDAAHLP